MPTVDERLERALADAAVEPTESTDVFGAVARKRRQRRTRRVARNVGAVVALVLVLVGSLAWLAADDATEPAVAPSRRDARVLPNAWLGAQPVALTPDPGYVRGPLIQSGEYLALAAYNRDGAGGFTVPPARVVRIDASGRMLDSVELQGEILSLADGEGARWVVTHDADNVTARQYRVKRIGADGAVVSNAFPPGVEPTPDGPIVASGGAVWVPVDGGVARFDPTTGAYLETVSLPGWRAPRLAAVGSDVYAYVSALRPGDGSGLEQLVKLAPASAGAPSPVRLDVPVVSVVSTPDGLWALAWSGGHSVIAPLDPTTGRFARTRGVELPKRFQASELQAGASTVWARGGFDDKRAGIVRITARPDGRAVADEPVVLRVPGRDDLVAMGGHEVVIATDGELYRVDIR